MSLLSLAKSLFGTFSFALVTDTSSYAQGDDKAVANLAKRLPIQDYRKMHGSKMSMSQTRTILSILKQKAEFNDENMFCIGTLASATRNHGSEKICRARLIQEDWERLNGFDPDED